MVTSINWFFWSTGPKSTSRNSASQPGIPLSWPVIQLPASLPRRPWPVIQTFLETRILSPSPDVNKIQIRAKGGKEDMERCCACVPEKLPLPVTSGDQCLCSDNQILMKWLNYIWGLRINWTTFPCWIFSPNSAGNIPRWVLPELPEFPLIFIIIFNLVSDKHKSSF